VPMTLANITLAAPLPTVVMVEPAIVSKLGTVKKPMTVLNAQSKSVLRTSRLDQVAKPPVRFRDDFLRMGGVMSAMILTLTELVFSLFKVSTCMLIIALLY
jgi:hypothetical protein